MYGPLWLYPLIDQPDKELDEDKFIAFAIKEVQYYIHDASIDIVWAFLRVEFQSVLLNKSHGKFVWKFLDTHSSVYAEKVVYLLEH